jgi:predicted Zn-dependent peptidase
MSSALPESVWGPPGAHLTSSTRITKLDNGVRVATQESMEPVACVGLAIDKGQLLESRSEGTVGLSAMLRRMLLSETGTRSGQEMQVGIKTA